MLEWESENELNAFRLLDCNPDVTSFHEQPCKVVYFLDGQAKSHYPDILFEIGHSLKKIGLSTRRLGKAGRGLVMDLATMTRVHELAAVYGGAGLEQDENNLHCPLCTETK